MAPDRAFSGDSWSWMCMLRGFVSGPKVKAVANAENHIPVPVIRSGGDCGPTTAAWLLNEHGPALYQARSPETCSSVRRMLFEAWQENLRIDNTGDECKAFVQQRLEQVPQAAMEETLEAQLEKTLQALLRDESDLRSKGEGDSSELETLPYWFLPTDWARLAEAYQVDFVLHGLPGTEARRCSYCGCAGHVHVGQRPPGVDLCLHVGWRGAGVGRNTMKGDEQKDSGESNGAWGHWEPLGSGPVQSPLARSNKADAGRPIDDTIDLTYPVCAPQLDSCSVEVSESLEGNRWSANIPGFSCVHVTSCTCQPAACQSTVPCQPGRPCPQKLKDCHICPTEADRQASNDGFGDCESISPEEKSSSIASVMQVAAPSRPKTQAVSTLGPGARFSFLVEGLADSSTGLDSDVLTRLRAAFVQAIATAASISIGRVRIVDVGPPLDLTARPRRRPAANIHENSPSSDSAGGAENVPVTPSAASPISSKPDTGTPDTGAGVLRFLGEEGPKTPSAELLPVEPAQMMDSMLVVSTEGKGSGTSMDRSSDGETARPGGGVLRVLAVIREQSAEDAASSEEHDAMVALDLVVADLASPKSALQEMLRQATDGRANRVWCPEAEGPHKGTHRWPAAAARSRQAAASGAAARLRRARAARD